MTEYPLLCANAAHCRPEDHGGPRQTLRAWFCPTCIDKWRAKLREMAAMWPDLEVALTRPEPSALAKDEQGRQKRGLGSTGLALNDRASDAMRDVGQYAIFLARVLLDERDVRPPARTDPPSLLRWVADWHLDFFAAHDDEALAQGVLDDAHEYARAGRKVAYPTGARRIDTGIACVAHTTSDLGERIPCTGTLYGVAVPGTTTYATLPDLVCTDDYTHRVEPATWRSPKWQARRTMSAWAGTPPATRSQRSPDGRPPESATSPAAISGRESESVA